MSRVGRQESMRWAAPEANYDGGDWEEDGLEEIAEEEEEVASIKSEELVVEPEQDYRDIYEYYGDDDDMKRQSYNQQLEDEIYERLTPGHSRNPSSDSQVDPELAALYQGTDEFLNRPISMYADTMQTKPLSLHTSDSDRRIYQMLNPNGDQSAEDTPQATPIATSLPSPKVARKSVPTGLEKQVNALNLSPKKVKEPSEAPPPEPEPMEAAPAPPEPTDLQKELKAVEAELSGIKKPELQPALAPIEPTESPQIPTDEPVFNPEVTPEPEAIEKAAEPVAPVIQTPEPTTEFTPIHSPTLASVAITPSDLPAEYDYNASPTPSRHGSNASRTSFVAKEPTSAPPANSGAPALALTCATPEGSDDEQDAREQPDWQPRWAPTVPRTPEPEKEEEVFGTDLRESQISLDDYSIASKPSSPHVKGFVDEAMDEGSSSDSDDTTKGERDGLDLPSLKSTDEGQESTRSTVGTLENDLDEPPVVPEAPSTAPEEKKSIQAKITRPPVVDLKAVFSLDTSSKRLRALWELRVKESEYTTQLSTWLQSTYDEMDDKSLLYPNGQPPESEGHALPTSRQVGTAITQSGAKTKETFQKVGKGFNVMKKLMRNN